MRKSVIVLSSIIALSSLVGCQKAPTEIKIVGPNYVITSTEAKEVYQYGVEVKPYNAVKDVEWSISDTGLGTIDINNGRLSNIKTGIFTITAKSKKNDKVKGSLTVKAVEATEETDISAFKTSYTSFYNTFTTEIQTEEVACTFPDDNSYFGETANTGKFKKDAEKYNLYIGEKTKIEILTPDNMEKLLNSVKESDNYYKMYYIMNPDGVTKDGICYYFWYIEEVEGKEKNCIEFVEYDAKGFLNKYIGYNELQEGASDYFVKITPVYKLNSR